MIKMESTDINLRADQENCNHKSSSQCAIIPVSYYSTLYKEKIEGEMRIGRYYGYGLLGYDQERVTCCLNYSFKVQFNNATLL